MTSAPPGYAALNIAGGRSARPLGLSGDAGIYSAKHLGNSWLDEGDDRRRARASAPDTRMIVRGSTFQTEIRNCTPIAADYIFSVQFDRVRS